MKLNTTLIDTLKGKEAIHKPIWLMRQAGRYLPEYRAIREKAGSFLAMAKNPEIATEITLQPLKRFNLDAGIIFSDILTIPDALGMELNFKEGEGPIFNKSDIFKGEEVNLPIIEVREEISYLFEAIRLTTSDLSGRIPLFGFSGSPFTLACYMVDGGASKGFIKTRTLLYKKPLLLQKLLDFLIPIIIEYLIAQVEAGVSVVQIFDTWGGLLTTQEFSNYSLRPTMLIIDALKQNPLTADIPIVVFTKGAPLAWYKMYQQIGVECIGVDWRHELPHVARIIPEVTLQGNLDPAVLLGSEEELLHSTNRILQGMPPGVRHIFNLGHGVEPTTDPEKIKLLVDYVHECTTQQ